MQNIALRVLNLVMNLGFFWCNIHNFWWEWVRQISDGPKWPDTRSPSETLEGSRDIEGLRK